MASRMSTFMLMTGSLFSVPVKLHGITIQGRSLCTGSRWPVNMLHLKFVENLGFELKTGRESKNELHVCWCLSGPPEVDEETAVSEEDLPQDVASGVGSSTQVEAFSRLPFTLPWGIGEVATTMVIFWAVLHVPLGLGGLDIVTKVLPQQFVDPQTQAVSLVFVQLLELAGTIWLVQSTLQPYGPLPDCLNFRFTEVWKDRGWLPASATGLLVLLVAVATTTASLAQDVPSSEVSHGSSALTELLRSSPLARLEIYVAYCGLTPCLEEYVYRGFLLSSLGTRMRWPFAVTISALVFSLSHLSAQGFLPLFCVGCCLGTAFTWNKNLATSFVIHSVYNAIVLTKALLYRALPGPLLLDVYYLDSALGRVDDEL